MIARERLADAIDAINTIQSRLAGMTESQLSANPVLIDACCYRICVVGEAVSYAKEFAHGAFAATPVEGTTWDAVVSVRNHFVHNYNKATARAVWLFYQHAGKLLLGLANVLGKL